MKLKKFNTAVATIFLVVVTAISSFSVYVISGRDVSTVNPTVVRTMGTLSFSSEGQEIKEIRWRNYKGWIPGKVTLKKWEVDNKVYYQVSGSINKSTIKPSDGDYHRTGTLTWGENTELEVFFQRDKEKYDQWLINPKNAQILHYNGDKTKYVGSSPLPESRYFVKVEHGKVITTFWCPKRDTPGNIVFNYNPGKGKELNWATTGIKGNDWNHHDMGRWTHP